MSSIPKSLFQDGITLKEEKGERHAAMVYHTRPEIRRLFIKSPELYRLLKELTTNLTEFYDQPQSLSLSADSLAKIAETVGAAKSVLEYIEDDRIDP